MSTEKKTESAGSRPKAESSDSNTEVQSAGSRPKAESSDSNTEVQSAGSRPKAESSDSNTEVQSVRSEVEASTPETVARRRFLARASVALGGCTAAAVGAPMVGFIVSPLFRSVPREWRPVGKVASFTIGA